MPSNPEPADEILAHPRFPEARHAHIEDFIGVFAGNRFMVRLLADAACLMTAALLVGFHAAYDENDTRTWATLGRLQRLIAARRLASPRRLDSLIARFRQTGY